MTQNKLIFPNVLIFPLNSTTDALFLQNFRKTFHIIRKVQDSFSTKFYGTSVISK